MPPKVYVTNYPAGDFRAMPALGAGHALLKWVTSFPGNPARGLPTVTGIVLLSDARTGCCEAVLDAGAVTALRTGAAAVLAAETLGRPDAATAAVIGAGVNGRACARARSSARGRERQRSGTSIPSARAAAARRARLRGRGLARGGACGRPARHGDAGPRAAASGRLARAGTAREPDGRRRPRQGGDRRDRARRGRTSSATTGSRRATAASSRTPSRRVSCARPTSTELGAVLAGAGDGRAGRRTRSRPSTRPDSRSRTSRSRSRPWRARPSSATLRLPSQL